MSCMMGETPEMLALVVGKILTKMASMNSNP